MLKLDDFSKQMELEEYYFFLKYRGGSKLPDWNAVPRLRDSYLKLPRAEWVNSSKDQLGRTWENQGKQAHSCV